MEEPQRLESVSDAANGAGRAGMTVVTWVVNTQRDSPGVL